MGRLLSVLVACGLGVALAMPQARRVATEVKCAADLGAGVGNPKRRFCDVIITTTASESVVVPIPAHTGQAVLMFDLHNRLTATVSPDPAAAFARHSAIIGIISPAGPLSKAGVRRDVRTTDDLFDRIAGGAGGSVKLVAPGQPQAVRVPIPAGIAEVGIVGERLEVTSRTGTAIYDSPGRPIALVSNVRVELPGK